MLLPLLPAPGLTSAAHREETGEVDDAYKENRPVSTGTPARRVGRGHQAVATPIDEMGTRNVR